MNKSGGVGSANMERGAAVTFVFALIVLAFAASIALVVEHRGQLGTSIVLAAIAASGLQWLAGRVMAPGGVHDIAKSERIADGTGTGAGVER